MKDKRHNPPNISQPPSSLEAFSAQLDALKDQLSPEALDRLLRRLNQELDSTLQLSAASTNIRTEEQEFEFRNLINNLPVGVLVQGPHAEVMVSNQAALDLLGLSMDHLLGKTSFDPDWNVIHEDGSPFPSATHPVPQAIATKQPVINVVMGVFRPISRDRVWLLVNAEPILTSGGAIKYIICAFSDITATRQLEAELKVTNERYQRATQASKIGVWEWELGTNRLYLDSNFKRLFGFSAEDSLDDLELWRTTIHPEDRQMVEDTLEHYLSGELSTYMIEVRILHQDGSTRWMLVRCTAEYDEAGNPYRLVGSHTEITDRKNIELALRERESRYRELFKESQRQTLELQLLNTVRSAVAYELDLEKVIKIIVESIAETFGYTLVSLYLLRDGVLHLQHQVGYDTVISEIPIDKGISGEVVRTGNAMLIEDVTQTPEFLGAIKGILSEITVPLLDGETVVGTLNVETVDGNILTNADLHLIKALAAHANVAIQRARLYTELQDKEVRARALLNAIPDMVVRMQSDGKFLEMKPSSYFKPAFAVETFITKNVFDIFPVEIAESALEVTEDVLQSGIMRSFEYELEGRHGMRTFEALIVPYHTNEILSIIRDITARRQADQRILELGIERERVEILTEFIQNASHDFRTPLGVMLNNLYLLRHIDDPAQNDHYFDVIERQITHLSKLLENMLTITHLDNDVPIHAELTDLNQLIRDFVDQMANVTQKKSLTLSLDLDASLPWIAIDVQGINRVLTNLVYNAIRHTSPNGQICLTTGISDNDVQVEVKDTGSGIRPDQLQRIFDRFYRGEQHRPSNIDTGGAGLGLAITRKIIEAHGGKITVESEAGVGSTFIISLPISNGG